MLVDLSRQYYLHKKKGIESNRGKNEQNLRITTYILIKFSCEETGLSHRNNDPDYMFLPPHVSERRCYTQ